MKLTKLQKKLCNTLQNGLPICERPFKNIAELLNSDETAILQQTSELISAGFIRRIGALINYRALGMTATLVAAGIAPQNLETVAKAVNSLENISHCYLRDHPFNLWFTLHAKSPAQIDSTLFALAGRFGVDFHSLPVRRIFKLDVRFDAGATSFLSGPQPLPSAKKIRLTKDRKLILSKLQNNLNVTAKPFDFLRTGLPDEAKVLRIIKDLVDKGVIRRIAAVVDHRKLGFTVNVLFACKVANPTVNRTGKILAGLPQVTHCYERKTFKGWPYNLFAMLHSRTAADVQQLIDKFTKEHNIDDFVSLHTIAELKKQPIKYNFA